MREILFRGKDQYNDWIYGYLCQYRGDSIADNGGDLLDDSDYYIRDWTEKIDTGFYGCNYKVRPSTISQYTGLIDKDGRKIFEGDIVKYKEHILQVEYADEYASYFFHNNGSVIGECTAKYTKEYAEIIGNIYDNPELLEVDE